MAKQRMAGEATIQNGAFEFVDGKMVPTTNTTRIMEEGRKWNPDLEVRPYNSVEAQGGVPMWGSGGGHYNFADNPDVIHIDPIAGDTHVVAHEVGHAVAPANLTEHRGGGPRGDVGKFEKSFNPETNKQHPTHAPDRTGAAVRSVYEHVAKPTMIEEASAQGFAIGLQHKLDIPYTNDAYAHVYDYPAQSLDTAKDAYAFHELKGEELNDSEKAEWEVIERTHRPAIEREYMEAYNRAQNGPQ